MYPPLWTIFDSKIVPGSFDKLRSYWAGPHQNIIKISPALAEVMTVYEREKPRLVSINVLKEFRGDSGVHGFPSDPPHSAEFETRWDERNSKSDASSNYRCS